MKPLILGHSLHDIMAFSASEKLSMLGMNLPDWSVTLLTVVEAGLLRGNVEIPGVDLSKPDPLFR